jgi:hypothetical protein
MKKLLALALLSTAAFAGEAYLGTIRVFDGGTSNNAQTTLADGGSFVLAGFAIPVGAKISLQARQDVYVGTGVQGCDAGRCLRLPAEYLLPTSTGTSPTYLRFSYTLPDAGTSTTGSYNGGVVAVAPTDGGVTATVDVYLRNGNE